MHEADLYDLYFIIYLLVSLIIFHHNISFYRILHRKSRTIAAGMYACMCKVEIRVLWPRSKNPYGYFAKSGVLLTAWSSVQSKMFFYVLYRPTGFFCRHRVIRGSLN